jgi:MFS transporter, YNFM family, putative membrane transport protein
MVHVPPADAVMSETPADLPASPTPPAPAPNLATPPPNWTPRGSGAYWRIVVGLFLVGYATFALIYCVQPLLPIFVREFHVSPAESSLSLSLTTGCLAVSILVFGALSENLGRKWLMFGSMAVAASLNVAVAFFPEWYLLLAARTAVGIALGGVPAVAMAYLAEEIEPKGLGLAMGLYVGGTAYGGMTGRVITGYLADHFTWPFAMGFIAASALASALCFALMLPDSKNFTRRRGVKIADHVANWGRHLRNPRLRLLFVVGFLAMGAFVTVYNYIGFHLLAPPFALSQGTVSLIFTAYTFGILSSFFSGALSDRIGRGPVLTGGMILALSGLALTLAPSVIVVVIGISLLTVGFFAAHSTASSWVGQTAQGAKGHAASLYLLAYYVGSSVLGSSGGWVFSHGEWPAVAGFCAVAWALTGAIAWKLQLSARARA